MSFESDKSFNDFVHFPRGIRRSGLFSIKESDLLEECGDAGLAEGAGAFGQSGGNHGVFLLVS